MAINAVSINITKVDINNLNNIWFMFGLYNPQTKEFLPLPVSSKEELFNLLALMEQSAASIDSNSSPLSN